MDVLRDQLRLTGVKGVGELASIPTTPTIINAIYNSAIIVTVSNTLLALAVSWILFGALFPAPA